MMLPPGSAGQVAHQFTTTARNPASDVTSQMVFSRRSCPLAIPRARQAEQIGRGLNGAAEPRRFA